MADTPNYGWIMPVVNASRNVWGTLLNTLFGAVDTSLQAVEDKADAAQADADALETRVDTLEGQEPSGWANWRAGQWYRSPICEGIYTALYALVAGRRYLIPFPYNGTFDAFGFKDGAGALSSYTCYVLDTNPDGSPGAVLWSGIGTVSVTGAQAVPISPALVLSRPVWLGIKSASGQIYLRGNSDGVTPHSPNVWMLGSTVFDVASPSDTPYVVYGDSAPYTAIAMGNFSQLYAPDLGLRTA